MWPTAGSGGGRKVCCPVPFLILSIMGPSGECGLRHKPEDIVKRLAPCYEVKGQATSRSRELVRRLRVIQAQCDGHGWTTVGKVTRCGTFSKTQLN